jgi:hypothetical protein
MDLPIFTHMYNLRFGWAVTSVKFHDFVYVEVLGENDEGVIYIAWTKSGAKYILKDANKALK